MLRALKEKAKMDLQEPKIDMTLVLSKGKAPSTMADEKIHTSIAFLPAAAAVPVSVASVSSFQALASSESSSCSIASSDAETVGRSGHVHCRERRFSISEEVSRKDSR